MIAELHEEMAQKAEKSPRYTQEDILRDFGAPPAIVPSELEYPGIFDKEKKKRYWVDEGNNCFMVHARALSITWGGDSRYWRWYPVRVPSFSVDVAELLDVCWLEVEGDFKTGYLTPGTVYEVSYVIRLKDPNYGWEDQVDFSLTLPQNDPKTCKRDLRKLPRGRWTFLRVGEFTPLPGQSGSMKFTLRQTVGKWKKGLVILGVDISPKL